MILLEGSEMEKRKKALGWVAVAITVGISGFWAYWGAFENFHEGWYSTSIWENIFMMLFQYLLITIVFVALGLVALKWRRAGLVAHLAAGGFFIWFFSGASFSVVGLLVLIPFVALGLLYFFGEPAPKKWAYRIVLFVPLALILAISIPQGIKVSGRMDDGDFGARTVQGNGVTLTWAPRGPGWPEGSVTFEEARDICAHLSEDGSTVLEEEQGIWRLPTAEEAVQSMMLHGENAGGVWDAKSAVAKYEKTPDKESPLWDVHSDVIYYWTADTANADGERALIIVYDGGVYERNKTARQGYLSFRAVKDAQSP
jgi:hypothetical protein